VSIPYEANGRVKQKQRTRATLIRAAQDLVAAGTTPTVEQTATAAGVSRAVGYRYFPNQHALLAAAHPETAATSLLPPNPPVDPAERLAHVVREFTSLITRTEAQQRTMLRLSLEQAGGEVRGLPLRQGRAIAWIAEALAPLQGQMTDQDIHQLALAIRSAIGIESLAWLTDVGGLSREEAIDSMRWTARALLAHALTAGLPTRE